MGLTRTTDNMKINSVHIKNLKSITDLNISFNVNKCYHLLYGANGVGKTTVLEAISLLGHVSSFSRMSYGSDWKVTFKDSVFKEALRKTQGNTDSLPPFILTSASDQTRKWRWLQHLIKCKKQDWWECYPSESPHAIIKYNILFKGQEMSFWICFIQEEGNSITKVLSGGGDWDDLNTESQFVILYSKESDNMIKLLLRHMLDVCPHEIVNHTVFKERTIFPRNHFRANRALQSGLQDGIVAYWNTDLNNFGRKNDVRESVKDIKADFYSEMRNRLGLDLSKDNQNTIDNINRRIDLNWALDQILPNNQIEHGYKPDSILITQLYAEDNDVSIKVARPWNRSQKIDFFSAGENEVFTIFMLLLWMPIRGSIILLDEPDLHLSTSRKTGFFSELFRLASTYNCQFIISTHSGFAAPAKFAKTTEKLFIRRYMHNSVMKYEANWTHQDSINEVLIHLDYAKELLKLLPEKKYNALREYVNNAHRSLLEP